MPIPDFQQCMRPLLSSLKDGEVHHFNEAYEDVCKHFDVSDDEKRQLLPSGKQTVVKNRCGWARTYMKKAGLLLDPKRSHVQITEHGLQVLKDQPEYFNVKYLKEISPEFVEFHKAKPKVVSTEQQLNESEDATDPLERLENAHLEIQSSLTSELLQLVKDQDPIFLENLVVQLMHAMGYGGWSKESGETTQYTADGGVDGFINDDPLGLDTIYLQAKRYTDNAIGRPDLQAFVGALEMKRARKGVFITTSRFSKDALDYIEMIEKKVVLIDGEKLASLMVEHNLGVATKETYRVKAIDTDFFDDV
ncbi:MAG: restriction endonuclease [Piscirickettsiaceae bacterium]|nr:restriction endonuclease [Piscirickettsiaceae bacterium]